MSDSSRERNAMTLERYWDVQGWLYGGDRDVEYLYPKAQIVRVRFKQFCPASYHEDDRTRVIQPGTQAIVETSWSSDSGRFGSCYTCFGCIEAAEKELKYED